MRYFLGVGAQKAGTTWLFEQLRLHPEIAFPPRKEVHYFDSMYPTRTGHSYGIRVARILAEAASAGKQTSACSAADLLEIFFRGPEAYRQYLALNATDRTKVVGEITPAYAGLARAAFTAARAALDPHIIFIMRDPLERYWSWSRMHETEPERIARRFQAGHLSLEVWSRSDYPALLRTLDEVFPQEQVLTLFYETLFDEAVLRDIARFLGVDPAWPWRIDLRPQAGHVMAMPDPPDELLERLRPVYSFVHQRFGSAVPTSWHL